MGGVQSLCLYKKKEIRIERPRDAAMCGDGGRDGRDAWVSHTLSPGGMVHSCAFRSFSTFKPPHLWKLVTSNRGHSDLSAIVAYIHIYNKYIHAFICFIHLYILICMHICCVHRTIYYVS